MLSSLYVNMNMFVENFLICSWLAVVHIILCEECLDI